MHNKSTVEQILPLRITLLSPPKGVLYCLQKGKDQLIDPLLSNGKNLEFSLSMRVKESPKTGAPNFLSEFVQGTPEQRFFYLCVGQYAGQKNTEWARRIKIHLSSITWALIEKVVADEKKVLVASFQATLPDGSPSCAGVPLTGGGWSVGKSK